MYCNILIHRPLAQLYNLIAHLQSHGVLQMRLTGNLRSLSQKLREENNTWQPGNNLADFKVSFHGLLDNLAA